MSFFIYLAIIIALGIALQWIQQEDSEESNPVQYCPDMVKHSK